MVYAFLSVTLLQFTGKGKRVTKDTGEPTRTLSGEVRKGRGPPSESTFHKQYHGLKTLHIHFHRGSKYQVGSIPLFNV